MVERRGEHLKAVRVVAGALAERAWGRDEPADALSLLYNGLRIDEASPATSPH